MPKPTLLARKYVKADFKRKCRIRSCELQNTSQKLIIEKLAAFLKYWCSIAREVIEARIEG
jgi:hypothetical protein